MGFKISLNSGWENEEAWKDKKRGTQIDFKYAKIHTILIE